jgi:hypothetical protein
MSETTPTYLDEEPSSTGATGSTADVAREQASRVADTAAQSGQHVASVAKDEAVGVAQEAKYQAKDLLQQAQSSLRDQAGQQQDRVASGLRSVGDELSQMASASDSQGMASDLVRQAADRAHGVASWLEQRDPGSLLGELKSYARRSPGTFIAIAAVAGVVAGRLTRSLTSGSPDAGSGSGSTGSTYSTGYLPPIGTEATYGGTAAGYATGTEAGYGAGTEYGTGTAAGYATGTGTSYGDEAGFVDETVVPPIETASDAEEGRL